MLPEKVGFSSNIHLVDCFALVMRIVRLKLCSFYAKVIFNHKMPYTLCASMLCNRCKGETGGGGGWWGWYQRNDDKTCYLHRQSLWASSDVAVYHFIKLAGYAGVPLSLACAREIYRHAKNKIFQNIVGSDRVSKYVRHVAILPAMSLQPGRPHVSSE